jgi:2-succinyl-5-enolpyruvyl-6-hydroxy-3-cyclohexene-1-carboxylate synthase
VWPDPDGALAELLGGDPRATLDGARAGTPAPPAWLQAWRRPDELAGAVIDDTLRMSEPLVARALVATLPAAACLVVASSMPIRDVETFAPARDDGGPRVLANRGANGIDGTVATALGVAASGAPTVLLTGDVALVHDLGGLASAVRAELPLAVVCLDNGGGGIFDFLPVAEARDAFEEHVATPPRLDLPAVAAGLGLRVARPTSPAAVGRAIGRAWHHGRPTLIHVPTDRRANVGVHREIWERVAVTIRTK